MSKKLVEDCHYIHAQKAKVFTALDIINTKKAISFLIRERNGSLCNRVIHDKPTIIKAGEIIDKLLKLTEEPIRVKNICQRKIKL